MKALRRVLVWLLIGMVVLPAPPRAQEQAKPFKPEELDQLVAPIALHPDSLVAQILMASTYPLEVVQAARFVKDKPNLKGQELDDALKQMTWDDSVKSLVYFPHARAIMNDKLDWLQKMGDAFLAQQADVLAAVQRLRARAQANGQLKSTPEQTVSSEPAASPATTAAPPPPAGAPPSPPPAQSAPAPSAPAQAPPAQTTVEVVQTPPTVIKIEPTNPQVVYVPSYDPTVVYGAWPPAYPPYYPYPVGYFAAGAFTFAAGAAVGAALWSGCNWGHGDVEINTSRVNNFTTNVNNRTEANQRVQNYRNSGGQAGQAGQNRGQWQHKPEHRKATQYRHTATQQRYNKGTSANAQNREAYRGRTQGAEGARTAQATGSGQGAQRQAGAGQEA